MKDNLNYKNLNTVLDYSSTEIITMYENNIQQNFIQYVEEFVDLLKVLR